MGTRWTSLGVVATYVCWTVVAVVWVGGAVLSRRATSPGRRRRRQDVASAVAAATAAVALLTPEWWWGPLRMSDAPVVLAGVVLLVAATVATALSRIALGEMWSSAPTVKNDHSLRTTGLYRFSRHPIYTGICGMLVGTALAQGLGRWVLLATGVIVALVVKARQEEEILVAEFPQEYEHYRQQVPCIVPRLGRRQRSGDIAR